METFHEVSNKIFPDISLIICSYIFVLSWLGHKETRFMMPIMPLVFVFMAIGVKKLYKAKYVKLIKLGFILYFAFNLHHYVEFNLK